MTRKPKDKAATIAANKQAEGSHQVPIGCRNCNYLDGLVKDLTWQLLAADKELAALRNVMLSAGQRCDVDCVEHGDNWPSYAADTIVHLRQRIETAHQCLKVKESLNVTLREQVATKERIIDRMLGQIERGEG